MWFILLLLAPVLALRTHEPPPPEPMSGSSANITEGWLSVRLNHFDATNTDTFKMRYFYNPQFSRNMHIVIFVGAEWEISPGWLRSGLAYELAENTNSALFYVEHRYYGKTRPTNGTTVPELRFLNVDQALGDLAQFIEHIRSNDFEDGRYQNANIALIGCSYGGSIATWMRLAYPHLITTALSDSGPLHAQEDFPEYLEVITTALRDQGGQQCVDDIASAMSQATRLLETEQGLNNLSSLFNTCSRLQSSPQDFSTLFWFGVTETFAHLVQHATPGDIPRTCSQITNSTLGDPLMRLASWVTSQPNTQPCIEARYSEQVAAHTDTSYYAPNTNMRLWTYQTCTEYGWYQTTSSARQPFLSVVPLEYFHQMCKDFFNTDINQASLRSGITRTNRLFAGLDHLPDYVVSVAGTHDPWSPMGPNGTHGTPLAPVYVVERVSHCRAIRPTGDSELVQLEQAKQEALFFLRQRLTNLLSRAVSALSSPALVLSVVVVYAAFK